jgi:hypothetical protein
MVIMVEVDGGGGWWMVNNALALLIDWIDENLFDENPKGKKTFLMRTQKIRKPFWIRRYEHLFDANPKDTKTFLDPKIRKPFGSKDTKTCEMAGREKCNGKWREVVPTREPHKQKPQTNQMEIWNLRTSPPRPIHP